jgi:hypothetical protein
MKNILLGTPTNIVLDQPGIVNTAQITLTVIGEDGTTLTDSNSNPLSNISLTFNTATNLFQASAITINITVPQQYIRIYFTCATVTLEDKYYPEDARLIGEFESIQEIVPVQYFLDYVLNAEHNMDKLYRSAVGSYVQKHREGIRKYLRSAQHKLETSTKLSFQVRSIVQEERDYYFDQFSSNLWQFDVYNPPINSLDKFEVFYGNKSIASIDTSLFIVDRLLGTIEFLPIPSGASSGLYTLLLTNLSGLAISLINSGSLDRVPCMFRASYTTGLVYPGCDAIEKESIQMAISQQALLEMLPKIDPALRAGSISESIDGQSKSKSFILKDIIKTYKEELAEFKEDLRMKYGRNLDAVVI